MRQFNLEEYVKNPARPIVTREGRNARVICTDRKGVGIDSPYPIVGVKDVKTIFLQLKSNGEE